MAIKDYLTSNSQLSTMYFNYPQTLQYDEYNTTIVLNANLQGRKKSDAKTERIKERTSGPVSDGGITVEVPSLNNSRVWVLIWGYKRNFEPT